MSSITSHMRGYLMYVLTVASMEWALNIAPACSRNL
ncbi:unnamed protein product [Linum tenue]|uniref:Uncharacterized protein n=1 Tax=Linum tenue TaxID=586396 RepID=A0AAV0P684_9ROSI|nr:unnamed protein product [Linum tenue]